MPHWTPSELRILSEGVQHGRVAQLQDQLPGRTLQSIQRKARRMGIKRPAQAPYTPRRSSALPWTTHELDILRAHFPLGGKAVAALLPSRSLPAIYEQHRRIARHASPAALYAARLEALRKINRRGLAQRKRLAAYSQPEEHME